MIKLYVIDLENEDDVIFNQHLTNLEINIISTDMDNTHNYEKAKHAMPTESIFQHEKYVKELIIGNTTFIVSSSFNNNEPCDIISKIARLIQQDN